VSGAPVLAAEVGKGNTAGDAEEVLMRFRDRVDAGRRLGDVARAADFGDLAPAVLGLPRGGVPVAFEIARALEAPLDVLVVRKLGVPSQPELAMGAIGEGGVRVENADVVGPGGLSAATVDAAERRERPELDRRAALYRGGRARLDVAGRCVIVVDDGIATGSSARAACQVARALGAARIVLAVPVASRSAALELRRECDELWCLAAPERFFAVGEWYRDFSATSDDHVVELLRRAAAAEPARKSDRAVGARHVEHEDDVVIPCGATTVAGWLAVPEDPTGAVIFAHGSGSSRHSPRNRFVAASLHGSGLATLLLDLLSPEEAKDGSAAFDVGLLAERLGDATAWAAERTELSAAPLGYFGASTGAAAALRAAAQPGSGVGAVVSRGGRPDLAGPTLAAVTAPTLLIVGECDEAVLELNRRAQADLTCENQLTVVPGATHLFEEPGALEAVAGAAGDWFVDKLTPEYS
jgi:putative phosphoribosyl transferase